MTTKRTYTVEFGGREFTRRTEHEYPFAAFNKDRPGFRSWVTFHKTHAAAKRAAGAFGEVKRTEVAR